MAYITKFPQNTQLVITRVEASNITTAGNVVQISDSRVVLGSVGNLRIAGGTSGQVLSTDGLGNLSWITGGGGGGTYSNANVASYLPTYTGNLVSLAGNIITTANVQAAYLIGNGSQLTGLPAGYSNANVFSYLGSNSNATILTTGNITGSNLIARGSNAAVITTNGSNLEIQSNIYLNTAGGAANAVIYSNSATVEIQDRLYINPPGGSGNAVLTPATGQAVEIQGNLYVSGNIIGSGSRLTGLTSWLSVGTITVGSIFVGSAVSTTAAGSTTTTSPSVTNSGGGGSTAAPSGSYRCLGGISTTQCLWVRVS